MLSKNQQLYRVPQSNKKDLQFLADGRVSHNAEGQGDYEDLENQSNL